MQDDAITTIPARKGIAAQVRKGRIVKVINTYGQQVVDTWAFSVEDPTEFMSMEHSRAHLLKLMPSVGDTMVTNHRRPILTFVEDTAGGIHDTLMAACDRYRYELLGCTAYYDNCSDNLHAALHEIGAKIARTPSPLNLFMNIPIDKQGGLSFQPPLPRPGSYVCLRAEMDLVTAFSACPQDMIPVNGAEQAPTDAHFQLLSAGLSDAFGTIIA